jgi:ribosome maturation factor RimP
MSLEKVTKDHPLRREQKWERFLGEKVEAGFKCPVNMLKKYF